MNRNGRPRRLTLHELFDATEPGEDSKDHNRGRDALEVITAPQRHTDRRNDPDGRGAGEPHDRAAGVQNRPCADESDAGDDLPRDASGIGACASRTCKRAEHGN